MENPPRIGVVSPYWSFWENVVEGDPRAVHAALLDRAVVRLGDLGEVVWRVRVDELDSTLDPVDLIVVVVTMAAPPERTREFVEEREGAIVLVWACHESPLIAVPFTHESITLRGATVGASMVTASLTRAGIRHDVVLGTPDSPRVSGALRGAAAASRVRGSRLLVIGEPLPGYDFVTAPAEEVARLGVELISRQPDELAELMERITPAEVHAARTVNDAETTTELGADAAARYAIALGAMVESTGARGGTINCHVASLRSGTRWGGMAPCRALGAQTSRGCPFTCTGDVTTALAMMMVNALGRPTMYHEMEAIDETTDEVVLANSGEHDTRFAAVDPPRVAANPWFPGENPTPIVAFQIAPGPASVVALTVVDSRLRAIVAEGSFTDRPTELTGTMTAAFRFAGLAAVDGWQEWVRAGAGHHACATDAHVASELAVVCRHLGIELVVIG